MDRERYRRQAEELVANMTVEEAASQLLHHAPAIERLGVPEYNWWNEALHGVGRAGIATVFPQAIGMAAAFDPDFLKREAEIIAEEARAKYNAAQEAGDRDIYKGLTYWSPNINIFRDPRWGRGHETYGEDPTLTGKLGNAFIEGLQGDGEYRKIAACAKHFAVHSGPEALRHEFNAVVSEKDLWETYLPAFETAVKDADVESVMGAYNRTNGEPCCGSKRLLVDILRGEWGFQGHVVSDCWAVRDFHETHKYTARPEESASLAVRMGCDLNCGCTYERLLTGLEKGLITEEEIRRSAVRLFTTRYALGMFDEDCPYNEIPYRVVAQPENKKAALTAAEESMVLLKNDGILPLKEESLESIGVIGPNAYSQAALYGNYHGDSDEYITNLDGIRRAVGDKIRIFYSQGCHLYIAADDPLCRPGRLLGEAEAVVKNSDVVILCVGLDERMEGEQGDEGNAFASGDKENLLLPETQQILIERVIALGKPVVLVIVALAVLVLDRHLFRRVDYALLVTFVCFFIFVGNIKRLEELQVFLSGALAGRELPLSVLISQVISNVPAAILLSNYTENIPALLIGTNLGGLGTLIASMASLISWKQIAAKDAALKKPYFRTFTLWNVGFLIVLYLFSCLLRAV